MKNVLIVDDEMPICEWFCLCFGAHPEVNKVYSAWNGEEAVRVLKENQVDMVFTDITMPKMDGLELLKYIREN